MKTSRFLPVLAAVAGVLFACPVSPLHAQTIPKGDIVVELETFTTLPPSSNQPARVNVLRAAPDGRIFVNDQRGLLYLVSADGATVTPYLDLTKYVPLLADNAERGFQSFVFHPDFNQVGAAGYGKFYTMASQSDTTATATFTPGVAGAGHDHDEVLLEWTVSDPTASTFVPANAGAPYREVLRIARPASNHNAGYLSFNPTAPASDLGNLYLGTGDSGGGGDPLGLSQSPGKVYGAILRINPLQPASTDANRSANGQYSIPADNPYTGNASLLKEKYAEGFRNPQRFTWDSANGHMLIADIGQNTVEEIDLGQAGANYGWNQREGSYVFNSNGSIGANVRADAATTGFTYPIAEYFHYSASGNAVTTGPVYRGTVIPGLSGRLVFSDFVNGVPYTLDADNLPNGGQGGITELRLSFNGTEMSFLDIIHQVNASATRADLRFGTDAQGNIYFLDKQDGVIRRVVTTPVTVIPPPVIGVTVDVAAISRAAGQFATVTFTRTGDLSTLLEVPYLVGGQTVNGQDFVLLKGVRKLKPGKSTATVKIVPAPGGANGKARLVIQPGTGYTVDPAARKAKTLITN